MVFSHIFLPTKSLVKTPTHSKIVFVRVSRNTIPQKYTDISAFLVRKKRLVFFWLGFWSYYCQNSCRMLAGFQFVISFFCICKKIPEWRILLSDFFFFAFFIFFKKKCMGMCFRFLVKKWLSASERLVQKKTTYFSV